MDLVGPNPQALRLPSPVNVVEVVAAMLSGDQFVPRWVPATVHPFVVMADEVDCVDRTTILICVSDLVL